MRITIEIEASEATVMSNQSEMDKRTTTSGSTATQDSQPSMSATVGARDAGAAPVGMEPVSIAPLASSIASPMFPSAGTGASKTGVGGQAAGAAPDVASGMLTYNEPQEVEQ